MRIPCTILIAFLSCAGPALAQDSDLVEDTSFLRVTIGNRTVHLRLSS